MAPSEEKNAGPSLGTPPSKCERCHNPTPLPVRCLTCEIKYCSSACLEAEKRAHKLLCESFASFTKNNPRPTSGGTFVRAALLTEDDDLPKFIWIQCRPIFKADKSAVVVETISDCREYLSSPHMSRSATEHLPVTTKDLKSRNTSYTTRFFFQKDFLRNGAKPIKFLQNLFIAEKKRDWRGQILITKLDIVDKDNGLSSYQDVTPNVVCRLCNYLNMRGEFVGETEVDHSRRRIAMRSLPEKILGVRLASEGDRLYTPYPIFQKLSVDRNTKMIERIMVRGMLSPISVLLGVPLYMLKLNIPRAWASLRDREASDGSHPLSNPHIKSFLATLNPLPGGKWNISEDSAWKPSENGDFLIGPVLLVRVDGQPLETELIRALIRYEKHCISSNLAFTDDGYIPPIMLEEARHVDPLVRDLAYHQGKLEARKHVLERLLTPAAFTIFF